MVGNVSEWCHSLFKPYPYKANDGRENEIGLGRRVVRGGAWYSDWDIARAAYRDDLPPIGGYGLIGFRVVVAPRLR